MKRLENKVALVTGGNSGIGYATAQAFIKEGARVIITGRNQSALDQAVATLGSQAQAVQADVSQVAEIERMVQRVRQQAGRLDVLFLNAGVAFMAPIDQVDEAFFDQSFSTNVKGLFFSAKYLHPLLQEGSSVIINASINAHMGMPGTSIYSATKAAVLSLARTLSSEWVSQGIRVNAISPGPIQTPLFSKSGIAEEQMQGMAEQLIQQVPMKRFGQPEEIAKAAVFLASSDSSFMVGAELIADGGMHTL